MGDKVGLHGGSRLKWLIMLTLQTNNEITVTLETDQIAQMTFCFPHWCLPSQGYETPGFQTSGYVTGLSYRLKINRPFREFFIGGI